MNALCSKIIRVILELIIIILIFLILECLMWGVIRLLYSTFGLSAFPALFIVTRIVEPMTIQKAEMLFAQHFCLYSLTIFV